jgi:hypothetical protein
MDNKVLEQLKEEYNEALNRMQDIGEIIANCTDIDTHHCGQDAEEDAGVSLKGLLGMKVVGVGKGKCEGCPMDHYQTDCCKVELVDGDYLCLTKPMSEEEDGDNVMGDIREKAEAFIDYLDSVIGD